MIARRIPLFASLLCALTLAPLSPVVHAARPAQTVQVSRAATDRDLTGLWKQAAVVPLKEGAVDPSNPWFNGKQYYLFPGGGLMKTVQLGAEMPDLTDKQVSGLHTSRGGWSYHIDQRGVTKLTYSGTDKVPEAYLVRFEYFMSDFDTTQLDPAKRKEYAALLPHKGDVTMTYFGQDGKPLFFRLLRPYVPAK